MDTKSKMLGLLRTKKMTLTELSNELHLAPSTINQHIKELLEAGAIEQVPNPFVVKWKYYRATEEFGGQDKGRTRQKVPIAALQPTWRFIPIVIVVALAIAAAFYLNAGVIPVSTASQAQAQLSQGAVPSGLTVFSISDSPTVSSITSVNVTVSQLAVHSATTGRWYIVFNGSESFDLVKLKNISQIISGASLPNGTYNEMTMAIANASATVNGTVVPVFVPSNTMMIFGVFEVSSNSTANGIGNSWINLDVDLAHSLHITANGSVIFLPVINLYGYLNSRLAMGYNRMLNVREMGDFHSHVTCGMDLNGTMVNGTIPVSQDQQLNATANASAMNAWAANAPRGVPFPIWMGNLHARVRAVWSNRPYSSVEISNGSIVIVNNENASEQGSINGNMSTSGPMIPYTLGKQVREWAACNASSQCAIVPTTFCQNGLPSQSTCVNEQNVSEYMSFYSNVIIVGQPRICPLFIVDIPKSCSCVQNMCMLQAGWGNSTGPSTGVGASARANAIYNATWGWQGR